MRKEISIIIPCYNTEKYIEKCIKSLINQTIGMDKIELIFINDASTDKTLEILQCYEMQYPESIILIDLPENSRQGTAKNIGLSYATGKYIGFCDSDDYIEPNMYEVLYKNIIETKADYSVCQLIQENENKCSDIVGPEEDAILDFTVEEFNNTIIRAISVAMVQCLFSKEFLDKVNTSFPERLTYEDNYYMSILNYYVSKISLVPMPLYHYKLHIGSTIQKRNSEHHFDRLKIELMKVEEFKRRGLFEKYREDIESQFIILYFVNTINILLTRFDEVPEGIITEMQRTVKMYFPNWKENILLNHYTMPKEKTYMKLIDYPFVKGDREEILAVL